jgi:hypothetical protein
MACINADGTLSRSGELILLALKNPGTPEDAARETGLPLFQVRSAVREFLAAHLLERVGGEYRATAAGLGKVEGSA